MKFLLRSCLLFSFLALACSGSARPGFCWGPPNNSHHVRIVATINGHLDYTAMAWAGTALVQLGDQPAKAATIIDRSTSAPVAHEDGSFSGTETISVVFADGSGSFDIVGKFDATPAATPGLYILHETGTLANGMGEYLGISGTVVIKGPFMHPDPGVNPAALIDPESPPAWIAELRGKVVLPE